MAVRHLTPHQSHYIPAGVLNECRRLLCFFFCSSFQLSFISDLGDRWLYFSCTLTGVCSKLHDNAFWLKRASLSYRRARLTFSTESSEMLISSDFREGNVIRTEPLALAQLPVCKSCSIWQRLLKRSQEHLKHMSVLQLHNLLRGIINDLFERKSCAETKNRVSVQHFLAEGTQFKDSSRRDPSYSQCTFSYLRPRPSVAKLHATSAALPAGKDANQILILAVEFADGWLCNELCARWRSTRSSK